MAAGRSEPTESWQQMLETTITSTYQMCKRVVPHMEAQGGGAIVNMSSIAAVQSNTSDTSPFGSTDLSYSTAKAAAEAYTRALAVEVGLLNIRVNCVRPGWIETPMTTASRLRFDEVSTPFFRGRQPSRRRASPRTWPMRWYFWLPLPPASSPARC